MSAHDSESFAMDPYAEIRPGLSPEFAGLAAEELAVTLGPVPASLVLHRMLNTADLNVVVSILQGRSPQSSMRIGGVDVPIPVYLRTLARLCSEVAEHSDGETPQFEQFVGPGGAPPKLQKSVGRKGTNNPDDIKLIQRLLNMNLPLPDPRLPEDGVLNDATIAAIENFQRVMLGAKAPDGRVDPNKLTFQSLAVDKLAFLPHRCQPLSGASVALDATRMNPGFLTPTGVLHDTGLQDIVNRRVLGDASLKRLRFALVDLTGAAKLAHPQYAGHQDTVQGGLGSMSKVATMYAAYQLKFDLEELSRQRGITVLADLFQAARDLWNQAQGPDPSSVTAIFPAAPKIEAQGKLIVVDGKPIAGTPGLSLPDLENIFTSVPGPSPGLTLRFIGSNDILVDPAVPTAPHETQNIKDYSRLGGESLKAVRRLSFAERLFLMIDKSDNAAAHSCIENVGFLFIHSALWQSDFYRPERGGGLWESSTHDTGGKRWIKPPVPRGQPGTDFVSATACSIAAVFTLLEQRRLVNRDACTAMKHLLNKRKTGVPGGSHTRSYFEEGLRSSVVLDRIESKLGIGNFLNDVAYVERTIRPDAADRTKDRKICYVAAGFDDPSPAGRNPARFLNKLIVELDKCILENNGLLSPSAP